MVSVNAAVTNQTLAKAAHLERAGAELAGVPQRTRRRDSCCSSLCAGTTTTISDMGLIRCNPARQIKSAVNGSAEMPAGR